MTRPFAAILAAGAVLAAMPALAHHSFAMFDQRKVMEIEYVMTDPQMWEGEWRSTKRWDRADYTDINEAVCILEYNRNLPGTNLGSEAAEERGQSEVEGVADE